MDTIIQQIVEKVIKNINKSFEEMINQGEGIPVSVKLLWGK